jgi:Ras-related GTP-binding protein C/D
MGLRKSGKSSILKVVFCKMSPHETLFLESTSSVEKNDIANSSFIQFQIWDFPGQIDPLSGHVDSNAIFGGCQSVIFVIDSQEDLTEALSKVQRTVVFAHKINPNIRFDVFIHKVDGLSDEAKIETQRDIQNQIVDELRDANLHNLRLSFFLTSIYDHTIFEAFSKVIQKLIPQLPTLETLHDTLNSNCRIDKSFLFDVVSKVYISTDSSPVDMSSYELCSDMIDVVIDVSCIYGMNADGVGLAYDAKSSSTVRLNNGLVLYLRHINRFLAIICIMREESLERQGLIDYNITCFKDAIVKVFRAPPPKD